MESLGCVEEQNPPSPPFHFGRDAVARDADRQERKYQQSRAAKNLADHPPPGFSLGIEGGDAVGRQILIGRQRFHHLASQGHWRCFQTGLESGHLRPHVNHVGLLLHLLQALLFLVQLRS